MYVCRFFRSLAVNCRVFLDVVCVRSIVKYDTSIECVYVYICIYIANVTVYRIWNIYQMSMRIYLYLDIYANVIVYLTLFLNTCICRLSRISYSYTLDFAIFSASALVQSKLPPFFPSCVSLSRYPSLSTLMCMYVYVYGIRTHMYIYSYVYIYVYVQKEVRGYKMICCLPTHVCKS